MMMKPAEALSLLRRKMLSSNLDGYIQPVHDEYMSEYPPACNLRLEWLTGFDGSAGTLLVLADTAALFVDGRYTLQAARQLDVELFEIFNTADQTPQQWAEKNAKNKRIGYDSKLYTQDMFKRMEAHKLTWVAVDNLVDAVWQERPAPPATALAIHEHKYNGKTSTEKRSQIAHSIMLAGADAALITAPDSVCWLLNIRGRDVENTPLVLAPLIINSDGHVELFVQSARVSAEVAAHLGNQLAVVEPQTLQARLAALGAEKKRIFVDSKSVPLWHIRQLSASGAELVYGDDPCQLPKATKNIVEITGIKNAHLRDGKALIKLLCWLDSEASKREVSELEVCAQLLIFRKENETFVEPSFNTISGSGANGAIVHYRATQETNRTLKSGELFLLDSGAQYPDGTTDITRTIAISESSAEHKDRFTRVLKGHIAIATAQFPQGTNGSQLDALARQYLWQAGLDYDHGTGHGVGCFLGVHEGPQRISKRAGDAALMSGMIISNEPGYYKTGEYGIRIENLVVVCKREGAFLGFETLTCVPIDTRLVDVSMLTLDEKKWLNDYHAWVFSQQEKGSSDADRTWLEARCAAI